MNISLLLLLDLNNVLQHQNRLRFLAAKIIFGRKRMGNASYVLLGSDFGLTTRSLSQLKISQSKAMTNETTREIVRLLLIVFVAAKLILFRQR